MVNDLKIFWVPAIMVLRVTSVTWYLFCTATRAPASTSSSAMSVYCVIKVTYEDHFDVEIFGCDNNDDTAIHLCIPKSRRSAWPSSRARSRSSRRPCGGAAAVQPGRQTL